MTSTVASLYSVSTDTTSTSTISIGNPTSRKSNLQVILYQDYSSPPFSQFPVRSGIGKSRAFNSEWYPSYLWLEYSIERSAAICYPCRILHITSSRAQKTFTTIGFRDWKHAKGKKGILIPGT